MPSRRSTPEKVMMLALWSGAAARIDVAPDGKSVRAAPGTQLATLSCQAEQLLWNNALVSPVDALPSCAKTVFAIGNGEHPCWFAVATLWTMPCSPACFLAPATAAWVGFLAPAARLAVGAHPRENTPSSIEVLHLLPVRDSATRAERKSVAQNKLFRLI